MHEIQPAESVWVPSAMPLDAHEPIIGAHCWPLDVFQQSLDIVASALGAEITLNIVAIASAATNIAIFFMSGLPSNSEFDSNFSVDDAGEAFASAAATSAVGHLGCAKAVVVRRLVLPRGRLYELSRR